MRSLLTVALLLLFCVVYGQQQLNGIVIDKQSKQLISRAIIKSSIATALSDYHGQFIIHVKTPEDTVRVVMQGYNPYQMPLSSVNTTLVITLDKANIQLKEVIVSGERNRIADSLENRRMFARNFHSTAPRFKDIVKVTPAYGPIPVAGITIFPSEFIRAITYKNSRGYKFKKTLLRDENDKYIDSRFNKALVNRLTKLHADSLEDFMETYRPTAQVIKKMTDYDIRTYIKKSLISFKAGN